MTSGLVQILIFQGLGELASKFLVPLIPGPVIGLVLLLGFLAVRKAVSPGVELVAGALVQHSACFSCRRRWAWCCSSRN